jgi:hypothetical protein
MPTVSNGWMKLMDIGSGSSNTAGLIPSVCACSINIKCNNNDLLQTPVDTGDKTETYASTQTLRKVTLKMKTHSKMIYFVYCCFY